MSNCKHADITVSTVLYVHFDTLEQRVHGFQPRSSRGLFTELLPAAQCVCTLR
jgi:hypothetical protein